MPTGGRSTLTQFLIEERRSAPGATGELDALISDVSLACKAIARRVAHGALRGSVCIESNEGPRDPQRSLDAVSHDIFLHATEWGGHLAGTVSAESPEPHTVPPQYPRGKYLLLFDPLDGSLNVDVNVTVGSIFSILRAPTAGQDAVASDFLQPGTQQVCAGYTLAPRTAHVAAHQHRGPPH